MYNICFSKKASYIIKKRWLLAIFGYNAIIYSVLTAIYRVIEISAMYMIKLNLLILRHFCKIMA